MNKIIALLVFLPATAQAATLANPYTLTYTVNVTAPATCLCIGVGGWQGIYSQYENGQYIKGGSLAFRVQGGFGVVNPYLEPSQVVVRYDQQSISFMVTDDTNVISAQYSTLNWRAPPYSYNVTTSQTPLVESPIPGALPMFLTGLGLLGWLGWREKIVSRLAVHNPEHE